MKCETEVDRDMQLLKQHITDGFPNAKSCLPESIRPFYDCRKCLTITDGVIMKGKCIVTPVSLHEKTLETLHTSHMGVSKTIKMARTLIFWLNMQKDIEVHLASCHLVQSLR